MAARVAAEAEANMDKFKSENHSAFIVGYTGEIGKALIKDLNELKIFKKVFLIGRREVPLDVGSEFEQKAVNFDKLDEHKEIFSNVDVGFCCLGTTRGKAGAEGFVKVDKDYVLRTANIAKEQGCKQFATISSQGANPNSMFLYAQTKGEVEEALKLMKFDRLSIYRPGILLCDRAERRVGEAIIRAMIKPVAYLCPTSLTAPVEVVARALINHAVQPMPSSPESTTYHNKELHQASGITSGCKSSRT